MAKLENVSLLTSTSAVPEGPWSNQAPGPWTSQPARVTMRHLPWPSSPFLGSARSAAYTPSRRSLTAAAPALITTWGPSQIRKNFQASILTSMFVSRQRQLEAPPPQLSATLSHLDSSGSAYAKNLTKYFLNRSVSLHQAPSPAHTNYRNSNPVNGKI